MLSPIDAEEDVIGPACSHDGVPVNGLGKGVTLLVLSGAVVANTSQMYTRWLRTLMLDCRRRSHSV